MDRWEREFFAGLNEEIRLADRRARITGYATLASLCVAAVMALCAWLTS